jgi:hypothetical protein
MSHLIGIHMVHVCRAHMPVLRSRQMHGCILNFVFKPSFPRKLYTTAVSNELQNTMRIGSDLLFFVTCCTATAKKVIESTKFKGVLEITLALGNFMNSGHQLGMHSSRIC